jgi:excinuclease ABC subunit C
VTDPSVLGQVRALPERPGVYLMRDARGDVLYVGKATSLRARVRSYFGSSRGLEPKVLALAESVATIDHILTNSPAEALLLEATLVKRHQPPHNVRLKDDKHYPYLKVDVQNDWPRVTITRRVESDGARYFGPYASAGSVRRTLDVVKKLFPWRSCTKTITGTDPRPCLDYYIKRCIAPCTAYCTKEEYDEVINQTLLFLEGRSREVLDHVEGDMHRASEALNFERAALLRDQAHSIRAVLERQRFASTTPMDADVFALARNGGEACVQVFFVRGTVVADTDWFLLDGAQDASDAEAISAFVAQFFESATYVPRHMLLSHTPADLDQLTAALREKRGGAVEVRVPERGELRALVASAEENARSALNTHRVRWLSNRERTTAALDGLQEELDLPAPPARIECYDISTIQGTNTVASMVVFENGAPASSQYRRFRIKTVEGQDDFASMREVLRRRFSRLADRRRRERQAAVAEAEDITFIRLEPVDSFASRADATPSESTSAPSPLMGEGWGGSGPSAGKAAQIPPVTEASAAAEQAADTAEVDAGAVDAIEAPSSWDAVPGLVVIDGGKGQLSAALDVMRDLGLGDIPILGLAKREEDVFVADVDEPIILPRDSQALYMLQRVRDEAHRFAITYHRNLRGRSVRASVLDTIPGIGPKRKRALLRKFGSVRALQDATVDEIASTVGFTRRLAETIKRSL